MDNCVVLEEILQIRLAKTIPVGMSDLPEHIAYRNQIHEQQERLEVLEQSQHLSNEPSIIYDKLLKVLNEMGISRYGFTTLLPSYLYRNSSIPEELSQVLVIVYPMDYEEMRTAPSLTSATELLRSYAITGEIIVMLSEFLHRNNIPFLPHHPMGDRDQFHHLLLPPHAVAAGLGEQGRTGLFIDHELGPMVRLGAISVHIDAQLGTHTKKGISEFCRRCKYCLKYCPPNALPSGTCKEAFLNNQNPEFKINKNRCFTYFAQHNGCGKCLINCILASPDPAQLSKRLDRIELWYHTWIISGKLREMYDKELGHRLI